MDHHTVELGVHTNAWDEENQHRRRQKKRKTNGVGLSFFKTHNLYELDSIQQKMHDHDLLSLIGKASRNEHGGESLFSSIRCRNTRVKVPCRRKITDKLIPHFIRDATAKFVTPLLKSFVIETITFDLWMSPGTQDIFDLIANEMDANFIQHRIHLRMVECNDTTGIALADVLQVDLDKHSLTNRAIACVKDEESNLIVCTKAFSHIVKCDSLGMYSCFEGRCMTHILSGLSLLLWPTQQ